MGDDVFAFIALFSLELEVEDSVVAVIKVEDNVCVMEPDLFCIFTVFMGENPLLLLGE